MRQQLLQAAEAAAHLTLGPSSASGAAPQTHY